MGYPWISTGDTKTHRLNLSRVVFRNGDIKTALSAGITQRSSHNWLNDAPLTSSTRNLSSLQLGVSHTQKILGGVATFNPTTATARRGLTPKQTKTKPAMCRARSFANGA